MLFRLDLIQPSHRVGNKALALGELLQQGFPVPEGYVVPPETLHALLDSFGHGETLAKLLAADLRVEERSMAVIELLKDLRWSEEFLAQLRLLLKENQPYAVRSSGLWEDMAEVSFAGQYNTYLQVQGIEPIADAILDCYRSMFSVTVLTYLEHWKIPFSQLEMAVIIQEMVQAETSGVAFTANPLTGKDRHILAEVAQGLGDQLVEGRVESQHYSYDWGRKVLLEEPVQPLLNAGEQEALWQLCFQVQQFFGHPCDIEFALSEGQVFLLQARKITRFLYQGYEDAWSTADFKDGGVSATVCTPYMWSLYEMIWEDSLGKYLRSALFFPKKQLRKLGEVYFGRPYWNLSVVKEAMARVPGYRERSFDEEFGVTPNYEGEGEVTGYTPSTLFRAMKIMYRQKQGIKHRLREADILKSTLLKTWEQRYENMQTLKGSAAWLKAWEELIYQDYYLSECTYFQQIFLNTIQQSLFRSPLTKLVGEEGYLALISSLDQVSHLLLFYDMWEITEAIKADGASLRFWEEAGPQGIVQAYYRGEKEYYLEAFAAFLTKYGYHSQKELDVTFPCYIEEPLPLVQMFFDTLALGEDKSPEKAQVIGLQRYSETLGLLKSRVSPRKYASLLAQIEQMRRLLWWREEFRDISSRYYYLIRLYSLGLGESLVEEGILEQLEDIWFLKIDQIRAFKRNELSLEALKGIITSSRWYYQAFRNYQSDNEIIPPHRGQMTSKDRAFSTNLQGIGCNNGVVRGVARVIEDIKDIHRLEENDILVSRFTDTGWTSQFAKLSGIVTEYGGLLCHAAIVSREYGIPCIVAVKEVTQRIKDGSMIEMDGVNGTIILLDEVR